MRDRFALSRVLGAITGVEEATVDRDEGIVIFAEERDNDEHIVLSNWSDHVPFQPASAMGVDDGYSIRVRDRDMVWLDPNQLSVLLVGIIDRFESPATPALIKQPEVGESSSARAGDVTNSMGAKVRKKIEEKGEEEKRGGCEEEGEKHVSFTCLELGSEPECLR